MSAVEKILKKYSRRLTEEKAKKSRNIPGAKTAGQVETELKFELNALLGKWSKAQEEKAKKKEEKDKKSDDKHTSSSGALSAKLWRDGSYNNNCYKYLKKNAGRRKVFETDWREGSLRKAYASQAVINHFKTNFGFGQRPENFSPNAKVSAAKAKKKGKKGTTAGNAYPYKWNGHHMIPCGAFYQGQTKKGMVKSVFTDDQYSLLLMSDFNVNHGQNVIPLPDRHRFFQPVHEMVLHPSSHNNYTKMVQKEMKELAKELKELESDADKPHPNISVEIAASLADFEDDLWDNFVRWGKEVVASICVEGRLADLSASEQEFIRDGALV